MNLNRRCWKRRRNKWDTEGQHRRPVTGGFRKQQMVCRGNRILTAIVRVCGGDAFAFEATSHRLAGSHIGEAVEWADQQYDCQQTDNDLNAAPHFYLQGYHQFDGQLRHSCRCQGHAKLLGFTHVMGMLGKDGLLDFCTVTLGGARIMLMRPSEGMKGTNATLDKRPVELY